MIESVLHQLYLRVRAGREALGRSRMRTRMFRPRVVAGIAAASLGIALVAVEIHTSLIQSAVFSWRASRMAYTLADGPSDRIRFPVGGPHDERLGYQRLPEFIGTLQARGYAIERQARISPALERRIAEQGHAIYRERAHAGLSVLGADGVPLYSRQFPTRAFERYEAVPPIVAKTLLFIEDRELLDETRPRRNPAVDWPRFLLALGGQFAGMLNPDWRQGGASTLATQIEKIRHSPGGRTHSHSEKLRQMMAASLRGYLDGRDTLGTRRQIVATYLDSMPLGARPDYGEIIGLGSALWAWYGMDLEHAAELLSMPARDSLQLAHQAAVYRRVLSLLLATRRPAAYLMNDDTAALETLTDRYLRLLVRSGVIDEALGDAALATVLDIAPAPPLSTPERAPGYKAAYGLRAELQSTLGIPGFHALDQLDLTVQSTIDSATQLRVSTALRRLSDPAYARSLGLVGHHLLDEDRLEGVTYGIVLYERGEDRNRLRLRADSQDSAFDINSGAKLVLGSSAKLRTLISYLNVIAELHDRLAPLPDAELREAARHGDALTAWAAAQLLSGGPRDLETMLAAAMQRRYSASPHETFFTGGGRHVFSNFRREENSRRPTVEEAFRHSINLAFVRLLRDVVGYYMARSGADVEALLSERGHPARPAYLARFADREGLQYLHRFHTDYADLAPRAALARLSGRATAGVVPQTVVFRSVRPGAPVEALGDFLRMRLGDRAPDDDALEDLHARYAPHRYTLSDRGYLAGVHPLELWLVSYLQDRPQAQYTELLRASAQERQDVYRWLFRTRHTNRQNTRIRILLEEDAFRAIHEDWRRQGYPFGRLVPSLATALGSSGDRPDALADLVGIILNDGMRLPNAGIESLRFAQGTPYETQLALRPPAPERVLQPEVAATVRAALQGVVEQGTAVRLRGAYRGADCQVMHVGGKTGTSDERFKSFGRGGQLLSERHVNRTATFVFYLGDRYFGTVTAFVPGPESERFHFTSSMVVQLLRGLAPELSDLVGSVSADAMTECAVARRATAAG